MATRKSTSSTPKDPPATPNVPTAPRAEAGVVPWKDLTEEQKAAGRQAHELIVGMVKSTEGIDKPALEFLPRLDRARTSRVMLIDGSRGSGKTALLLSVLHFWRHTFQEERDDKEKDIAAPDGPPGDLNDVRDRVIPIGLLDLLPLPPALNLLLHVIGRFERVVEWLEGDSDTEGSPPVWLLETAKELPSRKAWKKLLRAVAAGWDGNADARRARIDVETFMVELEEAERQRLDLTTTYTQFIEDLASDVGKRLRLKKGSPPLFLLAIDDADMDPSRSVELLNTVRMLWHPRVAFLLTGDSTLFQHTLAEHFLGAVRRPLHGHTILDREIGDLAEQRPHLTLASEVYEKIIPSGHRCLVRHVPVAERLKQVPRLADVFAQIAVGEEGALGAYFGQSPERLEALPQRLRSLIDLADFAAQQRKLDGHAAASRVVEEIWRQASPTDRQGVVTTDEHTGALQILAPDIDFKTVDLSAPVPLKGSPIFVRTVKRFSMKVGSGAPLSKRLVSALSLASNVSFYQRGATWDVPPSRLDGYEPWFAFGEYASPRGTLQMVWPLPAGESFPFYAVFASRWSNLVGIDAIAKMRSFSPGELGRQFLALIAYMWAKWDRPGGYPATWEALAEHIASEEREVFGEWSTCRAGLLAAPEYGLPVQDANDWCAALRGAFGARWDEVRKDLEAERRDALTRAWKRTFKSTSTPVERLVSEIDENNNDYLWPSLVEQKTPAPAS